MRAATVRGASIAEDVLTRSVALDEWAELKQALDRAEDDGCACGATVDAPPAALAAAATRAGLLPPDLRQEFAQVGAAARTALFAHMLDAGRGHSSNVRDRARTFSAAAASLTRRTTTGSGKAALQSATLAAALCTAAEMCPPAPPSAVDALGPHASPVESVLHCARSLRTSLPAVLRSAVWRHVLLRRSLPPAAEPKPVPETLIRAAARSSTPAAKLGVPQAEVCRALVGCFRLVSTFHVSMADFSALLVHALGGGGDTALALASLVHGAWRPGSDGDTLSPASLERYVGHRVRAWVELWDEELGAHVREMEASGKAGGAVASPTRAAAQQPLTRSVRDWCACLCTCFSPRFALFVWDQCLLHGWRQTLPRLLAALLCSFRSELLACTSLLLLKRQLAAVEGCGSAWRVLQWARARRVDWAG